jgi:ubiquinone/menaquinone biosynthesis C-methylase UbiE
MYTEKETGFVVPEVVVSHFHITEGDTVADFGAGGGFFLPALARRAGTGKIYACEIQKKLVEKVSAFARQQGLHTIYPLWCDLEEVNGIKIPSETVDVGILVNTLFQIEQKEQAIREMLRTIRPKGTFVVIDWTDSFGGMGPRSDHVVTQADATTLCEAQGVVLERSFPAGAHHYGLSFKKI